MFTASVWMEDHMILLKYFWPPPMKIAHDIAMAIPIMGCIVSLASLIVSIFLCIGVLKGKSK